MARTTIRSEDITAGQVKAADLASDATSGIQTDIAILGFKVAANGSLAKYDLADQTIDAFEDASGVDASASTNEVRNASNYYGGETSGPGDATGGTITYSGGNTIHSFTADGDFVVPSSGTIGTYLVVAGGGGGGFGHVLNYSTGGGGAGGYRTSTSFAVTEQTYGITVGAGGAGSSAVGNKGSSGADSVFSSITALGGGGGGSYSTKAGASGGSGGGGAIDTAGGAALSPTQGTAGGTGASNKGGGGGGATGVGVNGASGGTGGAGTASSITGSSVTRGGGGGGAVYNTTQAAGGIGGGGAGSIQSTSTPPTAGTPNTGGGGGGSYHTNAGGAGGSGIVILSYTTDSFTATVPGNLTLVSTATTAEAVPTKGDLVMTYTNGAGTATINTDIKGWVSRDNGTTYTQFTLADEGDTGGHTILTAHDLDISGQPSGTSMRYKITTHNQSASKETRIQAVSLGWS
jgi:hypothetical protein